MSLDAAGSTYCTIWITSNGLWHGTYLYLAKWLNMGLVTVTFIQNLNNIPIKVQFTWIFKAWNTLQRAMNEVKPSCRSKFSNFGPFFIKFGTFLILWHLMLLNEALEMCDTWSFYEYECTLSDMWHSKWFKCYSILIVWYEWSWISGGRRSIKRISCTCDMASCFKI